MQLTITIPSPTSLLRHWKWGLLGALALAIALAWATPDTAAQETSVNTGSKTQMDISIAGTSPSGGAVACNSATDSKCTLALGSSFKVSIVPSTIPAGGYAGWQTLLDYGVLLYKPGPSAASEIKWDESLFPVRAPGSPTGKEGSIGHGDVSAFFPAFPVSFQKTSIVNLQFNCARNAGGPFSESLVLIDFNASPSGTTFVLGDGATTNIPNVGSIGINCVVLQEINITTASVQIPLPHACYNIDVLVLGGSFNVCDNNLGGTDSHDACLKDGTIQCEDTDPADGFIRVAVVSGAYDVTQKQAPVNHDLNLGIQICDPPTGVKCEVTFKNTALTNPWHPPDLTGDGKVRIPDIVAVVKCFGLDKPAPLSPYPCP